MHERLVSILDLDAEVLGSHLDQAAELIAHTLGRSPRRIVDLGAGTGTGTRTFARHFPQAELVAVDSSSQMTALLEQRAGQDGFDERLSTIVADLDETLPALGAPDLVWAAMALHHVSDVPRLLRDIAAELTPGGVVAIVEMADVPRFFTRAADTDLRALEERCQQAATSEGWEALADWTDTFHDAGYEVLREQIIRVENTDPSPAIARYATHWLNQFRHRLSSPSETADGRTALAASDLTRLDDLLDATGPDALRHRTDLGVSAGRRIWITRPHPTTDHEENS